MALKSGKHLRILFKGLNKILNQIRKKPKCKEMEKTEAWHILESCYLH